MFETTVARAYFVLGVHESVLAGDISDTYHDCYPSGATLPNLPYLREEAPTPTDRPKMIAELQHLSASMSAYSNPFLTDRGNLLIVSTSRLMLPVYECSHSPNSSMSTVNNVFYSAHFDPSLSNSPLSWICPHGQLTSSIVKSCNSSDLTIWGQSIQYCLSAVQPCNSSDWTIWAQSIQHCLNAVQPCNSSDWTIWGQSIDYCLSQQRESLCKLEFSQSIMMAVILCNAVKAISMVLAIWSRDKEILVTVG